MATIDVKVPAIGDYKDVPVIDVLVKPGDEVSPDDGLVTLESDKATMDVPSPSAGRVKELKVKVGDRVSEGSVVVTLESGEAAGKVDGKAADAGKRDGAGAPARAERGAAREKEEPEARARAGEARPEQEREEPEAEADAGEAETRGREEGGEGAEAKPSTAGATLEVKVPAIGDYRDVPVIEVLVKPGDRIAVDGGLVTLESDKATMDVPSPSAGTVKELRVKVGDRVSEGTVVALVETAGAAEATAAKREESGPQKAAAPAERATASAAPAREPSQPRGPAPDRAERGQGSPTRRAEAEAPPAAGARARVHASPSVRKLARELAVDLARVKGSGPKGRILHADVQGFVKEVMTTGGAAARGTALDLPAWPKVDFAKFGPIEAKPLSRIQRISGPVLARNWVMIPHVTQFDEADITELEAFRVRLNEESAKSGVKVTLLAFLVKACVAALRRFPDFNASLEGDHLVVKRYFHIGFAADTPNGLLVPVVKDADQKGVLDIAKELAELAARAREGKLSPAEMQGGSFSISSLGGVGGTAFTPIINAPEVAILGISRSATRPVWDGARFAPRLVLPLSLSYDHRVIDGASAARFTSYLAQLLADLRRVML